MGRGYVVGLLAGAIFSGVSVSALSLILSPGASGQMDVSEAPEIRAPEPAAPPAAPPSPEAKPEPVQAAAAPQAPTPEVAEKPAGAETAEVPAPVAPVAPEAAPAKVAPAVESATAPTEQATLEPRPETPTVEAPAGSEFNRPKPEEEPLVPEPQPAPAASATPQVAAPAADDGPALTERSPAAIPEGQAKAPDAPAMATPETAVPAPADESAVPVPPPGEAVLPDLSPAEPDSAAPAPVVPDTAAAPAAPVTGFAKPTSRMPQIIAPAAPEAGAEAPITPAPEAAPETGTALLPPASTAPAGNKPRILTPGTRRTTENGPIIIDVAPQQPVGAAPQVGFGQKVPGVQVNRLPRIGDAVAEPAPDAAAAGDAPETAVTRYRATFENADKKPVIALVLIDDGTAASAEPEALGEIGAPVTVALDPESTGASVLAQTHRLAGDEVAILMPAMPQGATPSDLEVSYQAYVQTLPETVALVVTPNSPLQNDRMMAQHMAALLMTDGRGLATSAKGLNPARQAAERARLPYAGITRSLDEAGGDEAAILRLLDRAAFDASRGEPVVVMGHASPATVSAIKAWNAAGGHEAILGPLSAVLVP